MPWIEFLGSPEHTQQDVVDLVGAMSTDAPRAFKTHSPAPAVPFHAAGSGKDVKYVVRRIVAPTCDVP